MLDSGHASGQLEERGSEGAPGDNHGAHKTVKPMLLRVNEMTHSHDEAVSLYSPGAG
jgi:hypothetical protein